MTATPRRLQITPGRGLAAFGCTGPGTAYDPGKPAAGQRSACSHTYRRPSAAHSGGFRVRAAVVWTATWRGSDGSGGPLEPITRSTSFGLEIIEGHSLVVPEKG
ncbi:hypothetical protein [Spongiactinospora rosea]|uniref:hypothetical protein n=1 Tax=Spongiactinospora rosea TaxID=2248750 RepID=UPI0011C0816C|nr:hypothetical protein [Spongiactinospora rosea]